LSKAVTTALSRVMSIKIKYGTDENKKRVSSGLYFIKVKSGNIILAKKVMVIK